MDACAVCMHVCVSEPFACMGLGLGAAGDSMGWQCEHKHNQPDNVPIEFGLQLVTGQLLRKSRDESMIVFTTSLLPAQGNDALPYLSVCLSFLLA